MTSTVEAPPTVDRALLTRALVGLGLLLVVAALAGVFLRGPIEVAGAWFIGTFGWAGVFAGVLVCDASPLPLTHEPILMLAIAQDAPYWAVGAVASLASVCAGPTGYLGGWLLRSRSGARAWVEERSPGMVAFLRYWGATGVAIAALLPIPFAASTWTAGLTGVSFPKVALASLLRIPKTLFYLWIVYEGWSLGA